MCHLRRNDELPKTTIANPKIYRVILLIGHWLRAASRADEPPRGATGHLGQSIYGIPGWLAES